MDYGPYPRVPPTAQIAKANAKPEARLVKSVTSPIMVLVTPSRTELLKSRSSNGIKKGKHIPRFASKRPHKHRLKGRLGVTTGRALGKRKCYLATRLQKVRERPKSNMEVVEPTIPINRTGFRPILSESRFQ